MRFPWIAKNERLIIDVGVNNGDDSAFYLKKGFRVVGIEADPALVAALRVRFAPEIAAGRFVLVDKAIAPSSGKVTFYANATNDEWGTIDERFATRNLGLGAASTKVELEAITFGTVLNEFGIPYFLKIDVEGVDMLCVQELRSHKKRPTFVSLELSLVSNDEAFEQIDILGELGYRHFKIVNQGLNEKLICPRPAREGRYVEHKFNAYGNSGLFGEETPGAWETAGNARALAELIVQEQAFFGAHGSLYHTPEGQNYCALRAAAGDPVGWYDIHAKI